jgi:hypothetical protein
MLTGKERKLRKRQELGRKGLGADFLSHDDAAAFCAWTGYRLPRERDYMVAALVDDAVHDDWMDDEDVLDDWIASARIADLAQDCGRHAII